MEACSKFCRVAAPGSIVNSANSVVPANGRLYKRKGLDPTKVVGITTLDVVRANKFVALVAGKNPNTINILRSNGMQDVDQGSVPGRRRNCS